MGFGIGDLPLPKLFFQIKITHSIPEAMDRKTALIHWTPRLLGLLTIMFFSLFALDSFEPGLPFFRQIAAFLMHLIPSFGLAAILILAWKNEMAGGIVMVVIGVVLSVLVFNLNYQRLGSAPKSLGIIALVTFPFVLDGILFLFSHYWKKRHR